MPLLDSFHIFAALALCFQRLLDAFAKNRGWGISIPFQNCIGLRSPEGEIISQSRFGKDAMTSDALNHRRPLAPSASSTSVPVAHALRAAVVSHFQPLASPKT